MMIRPTAATGNYRQSNGTTTTTTFNAFHNSGGGGCSQKRQRPLGVNTNHHHHHHHPLQWSLHNGIMYYGDSDDDSGIGHSNNGGGGSAGFAGGGGGEGGRGSIGDRVGSTSSAEAEVTPTRETTTSKEVRSYSRSRNIPFPQPHMGRIQLEQQRRTVQRRQQQQPKNFYPLRPPPPIPIDSLESSDEVFHSFCAWLDRKRPTMITTNGGTVSRCCTNGQCLKVFPRTNIQRPDTEMKYGHIGTNKNSYRIPPPPLPFRTYEGDSSRYANVYENMFRDGVLKEQTRTRPLSLSATNELSTVSVPYSRPPPRLITNPRIYSDRDFEPSRLQRARSTSLASLITIDSDMVRVRACPAAVIPASEAGDSTLNESFCSRNDRGIPSTSVRGPISNSSFRNFPGCYESITSNDDDDERQPPLPPRSSLSSSSKEVNRYSVPPPRPLSSSVKQIPITLPHPPPLVHSSPKDSQRNGESNGGFKEVEYAQVIKPKKKSAKNGSVNNKDAVEESEPPLPPRNYRSRHLTRNGRNSSSRSSFTERVQDFTRSAKQALRKAFSLDGLNRRTSMDRSSLASRDWDVDSEWGERRRSNLPKPPRTPAEVKARDADRDRRHGGGDRASSNRKHVSVTLC